MKPATADHWIKGKDHERTERKQMFIMYTRTETQVSCWKERKVEWTERIRDATELRQIALITVEIKSVTNSLSGL